MSSLASYGGTDEPTVVAQAAYDVLLSDSSLGIAPEDLYYGDQELIPRTPTICVEAGLSSTELAGVNMMVMNTFTVYIMIYHCQLGSQQVTQKECEQLAYAVRKSLHSDKQMGGNVLYGLVATMEPGYAQRANRLLRTTRITWRGQSKVMI